jgi:hypothetical protein
MPNSTPPSTPTAEAPDPLLEYLQNASPRTTPVTPDQEAARDQGLREVADGEFARMS